MSILDDEDVAVSHLNNEIINTNINNTLKGENTREQNKNILDAYYIVSMSYIDFFMEYFFEDNYQKTNEEMIKRLVEKGVVNSGSIFSSNAECNALGYYVLKLSFPTTMDQIKEFRDRVMKGDLEFRCRYPIGETCAFDIFQKLEEI